MSFYFLFISLFHSKLSAGTHLEESAILSERFHVVICQLLIHPQCWTGMTWEGTVCIGFCCKCLSQYVFVWDCQEVRNL